MSRVVESDTDSNSSRMMEGSNNKSEGASTPGNIGLNV